MNTRLQATPVVRVVYLEVVHRRRKTRRLAITKKAVVERVKISRWQIQNEICCSQINVRSIIESGEKVS